MTDSDSIGSRFHSDLAQSQSTEVEQFWLTSHSMAFKNFTSMVLVEDLGVQRSGIDRTIHTASRTVTVEEKCDYTAYDNIALEVESTIGFSKGWIEKDIKADVLAYGFIKKTPQVVYYFSTVELLSVWQNQREFWKVEYGFRTVWCSRTIVCPVPIEVLTNEVKNHYRVVL